MNQKAYFDSEKLKKFLDKDEPVCREERQFALLLYNVFLQKKRKGNKADEYENEIVKKCLFEKEENVDIENVCIIDVYFEATLMRDYFNACENDEEKDKFNKNLLNFCLNWLGEDKENVVEKLKENLNHEKDKIWQNLGQSTVKQAINKAYPSVNKKIAKSTINNEELINLKKRAHPRACLQIASMMMNATPDLLVIYEYKDDVRAKALECKYLSGEGRYTDVADAEIRMQYFIQECVMKFCFGFCEKESHINEHVPKCPTRGTWEGKEKFWEELCKKVYEGILQEPDEPKDKMNNCGVGVIRFISQKNEHKKKLGSEIWICVKDLLANMYYK